MPTFQRKFLIHFPTSGIFLSIFSGYLIFKYLCNLGVHWKDWCWSWNSNTSATWCEEPTHWKRTWCWERLRAGRKGDDRGWDGWMASPTRWTWVWVDSGNWWWTGRPGVLRFMGSQRVGHDWATELNWTGIFYICSLLCLKIFSIEWGTMIIIGA